MKIKKLWLGGLLTLAFLIAPAANAQVLLDNNAGRDSAVAFVTVTIDAATTIDQGRPGVPDPPTGLDRTSAMKVCNPFRGCGVTTPIPTPPRPDIPPLVTLTTELVIDSGSCFIRFTATAVAQPTGDYVTFSSRPIGSTGSYTLMFATYTVAGKATFLAPAKLASGEWRAIDQTTGEPSDTALVSNALPIFCGA